MRSDSKIAALLIGIAICLSAPANTALAQPRITLTGCLDEEAGPQYVLREPRGLRVIALLKPVGFPAQDFAKHVGHTVAVTGSRASATGTQVINVRTVRELAGSCTSGERNTGGAERSKLSSPTTASGCLDEEAGPLYVLLGEQDMKPLMELEPEGFPVQNFARYLGHRVELKGRTYSRNEKTVMRVQSIKSLADECAPK